MTFVFDDFCYLLPKRRSVSESLCVGQGQVCVTGCNTHTQSVSDTGVLQFVMCVYCLTFVYFQCTFKLVAEL